MKRASFILGVFLGLPILLSGCLYGQCMNGACALEREAYLKSIKAYGEHWVKEGVTAEQKRSDSWACGAARTTLAADHVVFSPEALQSEKRAGDKDDFAPRTRLTKSWIACMESRGYQYKE